MFSILRSRIPPAFWLLLPTLLWSLSLRSMAFCVDPFLLPAIEKRLPIRVAALVRWVWVLAFGVTLLANWNISPGTYMFYLHEALPFAPKFVLGMLAIVVCALIWLGAQRDIAPRLGRFEKPILVIGASLFVIKALAAMEVIHVPEVRHYLRSTALSNSRKYVLNLKSGTTATVNGTPNDTFYAVMKRQSSIPPQVVLMVVESWGEKKNALSAIANDVAGQGFQVIKYGFSVYRGSTLSGEFRELCSTYLQPSDGLMDAMKDLRCAPQFMHDKGYDVVGFHGYKKTFYARATFWTRFGIQHQNFGEDLAGQPECPGPFPGVCDENLIQDGIGMLDAAGKPTFLYMLTLSSHEPVDPDALQRHGAYFNEIPVVHPTQNITRRAISSLVTDLKNRHHRACTLVYVVGDHQPPSASAGGGIFETGKVPYLMFTQDCPASPTN
jgi:phosphoglycerol transferase MdoB-like AlkP superfamily enzyme